MVAKPRLDCVLLEKYTVAPAPSRDYYGIKVCPSKILVYHWKVSRSQTLFPTVQYFELGRFICTPSVQDEIENIFGNDILINIFNAAKGDFDHLSVLPLPILRKIFIHLPLNDIAAVALTCKRLSSTISDDDLWINLYRRYFNSNVLTKEERNRVRFGGWKRLLKEKLMYIHKIPRMTLRSWMQDRNGIQISNRFLEGKLQTSPIKDGQTIVSKALSMQQIKNKDLEKKRNVYNHLITSKQDMSPNKKPSTPVTRTVPITSMPICGQSKVNSTPSNKNRSQLTKTQTMINQNRTVMENPLTLYKSTLLSINSRGKDTVKSSSKISTSSNPVKWSRGKK